MSAVASGAGVSRESVYRMLSKHGNPTYRSLAGILKALDLRLSVSPISKLGVPLSTVPTAAVIESTSGVSNTVSPPSPEVNIAQYSMWVKMGIAAGIALANHLTLVPYNSLTTPDYGYVRSSDILPLMLFDNPECVATITDTHNQGEFSSARCQPTRHSVAKR